MDAFWLVMRVEESAFITSPTVQHATEQEALVEAERLAKKHPGVKFAVLQLTRMVHVETEPRVVHESPWVPPSVYEQYPVWLPPRQYPVVQPKGGVHEIPQFTATEPLGYMTVHNKCEVNHV
jgi:hypothetical protein